MSIVPPSGPRLAVPPACFQTSTSVNHIGELSAGFRQQIERLRTQLSGPGADEYSSPYQPQLPGLLQFKERIDRLSERLYQLSKQLRPDKSYRERLPGLLQLIYSGYEAGNPLALYQGIQLETPENRMRLTEFFEGHGVHRINPSNSLSLSEVCAKGMADMTRILTDLGRREPEMDSHVDVEQVKIEKINWELLNNLGVQIVDLRSQDGGFAQEAEELKASCQKLHYLLRTGRSSSAVRNRTAAMLNRIESSPALDIDRLQSLDDFTELYLKFCELSLEGGETKEILRALRKLVEEESEKADKRVQEFEAMMKAYSERGRQNLAGLMAENAKAARKAGFREGVSSATESQQICDELQKVDQGLAKILQRLKDAKDFWTKVDGKLKSASYTPTRDDSLGGSTNNSVGHQAQEIQVGLETIHQTTQKYSESSCIRKSGGDLVRRASDLTQDYTRLSRTQSTVSTHLENHASDPKSGRQALSPLMKGLSSIVKGYEKLLSEFTKYGRVVYLFFWFAGTTAAEKMRMERPDHVAHAVLLSKGLSSYVLPFESALTGVERHLRGIQKSWIGLEVTDWDGIVRTRF
ncbi:hypothetical protein FB451DRAFT_491076 [Mycena latifolia]|nr:hypothetical protein FB451DRAFT_491076 [Mycena latifolia]